MIPQEEFEHGEEEFGYGSAEGGEQNEVWDSSERCSACIGCRSLAWRTSGAARAAARETKCNGRGERGVMKMERVRGEVKVSSGQISIFFPPSLPALRQTKRSLCRFAHVLHISSTPAPMPLHVRPRVDVTMREASIIPHR